MDSKKIIISGIGPSELGVGRLFTEILKINKNRNYNIKALYNPIPNKNHYRFIFKILSCNSIIFNFIKSRFQQLSSLKLRKRIFKIKNSTVLLIHPQFLGLEITQQLILNDNKMIFYVMDNSFFCLKSFNHINGTFTSCLNCLGSKTFKESIKCSSFPVKYSRKENITFLKILQEYKSKITFLTQSKNQTDLLLRHFGQKIVIYEVGMYTSEFFYPKRLKENVKSKYSICYHGSALEAKGILFVLELAKILLEESFFIPISKSKIRSNFDNVNLGNLKNVTFRECTWESGLKEIVISSKIVLNPSLWSSPIEGALIKSILHNGVVAVVNTPFSFQSTFNENQVIKLSEDIKKSSEILKYYLKNTQKGEELRKNSLQWYLAFYEKKEKNQEKIFNLIKAN